MKNKFFFFLDFSTFRYTKIVDVYIHTMDVYIQVQNCQKKITKNHQKTVCIKIQGSEFFSKKIGNRKKSSKHVKIIHKYHFNFVRQKKIPSGTQSGCPGTQQKNLSFLCFSTRFFFISKN